MTNDELKSLSGQDVSRETFDKLSRLVTLIIRESENQNLVSKATLDDIWVRHVVDSLQLAKFFTRGIWLDLGTGAGFPGLVIACLNLTDVVLVEERRLRFEFLSNVVAELSLSSVKVVGSRIERVEPFGAGVISARAFASLEKTLALSAPFCTPETRLILPKGKNAADELASVSAMWHGDFRLEPSVTDPNSSIIVADRISRTDHS